MVPESQLRALVAGILVLESDEVQPETSLSSLDNSLGEAKLRLGLKRLGLNLPAGSRPTTFGQLSDLLSGTVTPSFRASIKEPDVPLTFAAPFADLQVGLDVQEISQLPASGDYWEDAFYRDIFDKTEIAYAVVQSEPRIHFAGFWCAKEALRKCDAAFVRIDAAKTIVAHDDNGRPYFLWNNAGENTRLQHALSISHTGLIAMAVVAMTLGSPPRHAKPDNATH